MVAQLDSGTFKPMLRLINLDFGANYIADCFNEFRDFKTKYSIG
jgi:hypothetical protein